ncbi:beta-lactamase/transpeptidase-like protein [Trematosphaeria pertusa]|uniref:Beta-lactamase/transpeptidase-like protein n=1 Tax=Trematosphaeria pertusa TaxID=390896 RepID=A0A6A6I115_9PLEO|nr:beta-lactamase/transpeptidase-like protein [Trematosphaeria pertusa]KAF2243839.1 beta-lactamase/transpeptidase-like protein [Trematosphaeria pertusa]
MDSIKQQLEALRPEIDHILQISGSPALSLGVLHRGAIIHTAHFGHLHTNESKLPNDDTIHWVASLTKLITAAAIAKLVHDGKLHWDVPIREYLSSFRIRQDELGLKATLRDLLSNRTGITPANNLWGFQNSEPLMKKSETTFTATYLSSAKPFGQFVYSQWNYALVDDVVKEVTGASLCDYIEQNLFRPLHMTRSSFDRPQESDANVAHTHCTHDDGTPTRKADFAPILVEAGSGVGAGARSSIKDYMIFLQALLSAYKNQHDNGVNVTPGSIFPLTRAIFTPQVGFGPPHRSGIDDVAYCMGIYRTKLPGYLSFASPNFYYTLGRKRLPPYGTRLAGTEVFHHSGTGPGHLGAMYLVPSTESAVVALTNSQPLMDPVDFAAQLALSVLLGEKPMVYFVKMAQLGRAITLENYEVLKKVVAEGKTNVPPTKPLAAYEGDYYNAIHNFVLSVTSAGDCLNVNMQRGKTGFTLLPYDGDTFYWPVDREEETCTKTMWGFMYKDWHLFRFEIDCNGEVEKLTWRHDPYLASPEIFRKTPTSGTFARL